MRERERERERGKAKSNQRKYAITQSVHFPRNAAAAMLTAMPPRARVTRAFGRKQGEILKAFGFSQ